MAKGRVFTVYRRIITSLGLKELDVYRVVGEDGIKKDILRLYDFTSNKVVLVDLGTTREAMSPVEFLNKVVEKAREAGISLPERKIRELSKELSEKQEAVQEQQ